MYFLVMYHVLFSHVCKPSGLWLSHLKSPKYYKVFINKKINYNPKISHGYRLSSEEIKGNFNELYNMSESERLLIPSMHSERVDVIVPGTFLLYQILTFFNKNEITCSEKDLLEGHFITTYL